MAECGNVRACPKEKPESACSQSTDELIDELLGDMEISMADAEKFGSPNWIYENLIIEGHILVVAAQPNGGKTTIFWNLCPSFIERGYHVLYINDDVSAVDAKSMLSDAHRWGVRLLLPSMGTGEGMEGAIGRLEKLAKTGADLTRQIFIIDTLKKAVSPNQKDDVRGFMKLCRRMTSLGATIILLGHTLKRYNSNGLPEYEGVGDIRADADELIYLLPQRQRDGSLLVSTRPDKTRGSFKPISFLIKQDRSISHLPKYVDLRAVKMAEQQLKKDWEAVEEVHEILQGGAKNQSELIKLCNMGPKTTRRILKRYKGQQWSIEVRAHNALYYHSLSLSERTPTAQEGVANGE